jgi:hypothetical protein
MNEGNRRVLEVRLEENRRMIEERGKRGQRNINRTEDEEQKKRGGE